MHTRMMTTKAHRNQRGFGGFPRPAFSMTEMVFAIFILGIGLLFTSSMFPIAWTKARDVFEATSTESCAKAGEGMFMRTSKVNRPTDIESPPFDNPVPDSTFFPNDWFSTLPGDLNSIKQPFVFPTTRVHTMNLGNIKAEMPFANDNMELDDLKGGGELMPVGDNGWRLSDQLAYWMGQPVEVQTLTMPDDMDRAYFPNAPAHTRMSPPMTARPDPIANPPAAALWDEQFAGRRYCWSVLYRFSRMFGPDPDPSFGLTSPPPLQFLAPEADVLKAMAEPREMTVYYVTLKRPANARYARQQGLVGNGSSATWDNAVHMDQPRAMTPDMDVLMPAPWRIEASLLSPPDFGELPKGIPSEIRVTDIVLADMLAPKTTLIDERNGQVYRITQRRETSVPATAVLVLDKEYTVRDVRRAPYIPFPSTYNDLEANWLSEWEWEKRNCDELDLNNFDAGDPKFDARKACRDFANTEANPEKRYYWVFPPPVEAARAALGVPTFAGSPPVVEVTTRQVMRRPDK